MKPAHTVTHFNVPHSWSDITHGEWVAQLLQARIDEWCPKLFGYHMLKLGGLSAELTCGHCNITHQISVDKFSSYRNVEADSYDLPFLEKSFDACLLMHQLDFSDDPHRLLREIDRVMVDDGYLLLSGRNPFSLAGCCHWLPRRQASTLWRGAMFLPSRVQDWLALLNYEVIYHETFAVLPATRHLACSAWLENVLAEPFAGVGSLYFIVARKRTFPLKPIKPKWQVRRQLAPLSVNCRTEASRNVVKRDVSRR